VRFFRAQPPKPHPDAFAKVFAELGLVPPEILKNVAYIGDRIYTDIYAANRVGFELVIRALPFGTKETIGVRMARKFENFVYANK